MNIKLFFCAAVSLVSLSFNALHAQFDSDIFLYDDPVRAMGLHASFTGSNWSAHEVQEQDIPFYQELFSTPAVMETFGERMVREPSATKERLEKVWLPRFASGQPHGGMTVVNSENVEENFGYVVAGAGDASGVSEVAYAYMPAFQGRKIGSGVLHKIVHEWAPEVRRIGLGVRLDKIQDAPIINAFQCFGGQVLDRLDATASPFNRASWHMLDKEGFVSATFKVQDLEPVLDFDQQEFSTLMAFETKILESFDAQFTAEPLTAGTRYRLLDFEGQVRTFSKHTKYKCLKYHLECIVG